MKTFRDAIARIDMVDGTRGTGFIAGPGLLLTAFHVLFDRSAGELRPGPVRLVFRHREIEIPLVATAHDSASDWILLQFPADAGDPTPLPFAPLNEEQVETVPTLSWKTHGYPESNPMDGKDCWGLVRTTTHRFGDVGAIQLFSVEAASGLGEPVAGYSGAPVLVNGVVVGVLRTAEAYQAPGQPVRAEAGTLYACPIDAVLARAAALLPPPETQDPLPPLPAGLPLPEKPFRNLLQYQREDARVYFGRTDDLRRLHAIVTAADTEPVVLVYGQAGVGKSSVLSAGLGPRLEAAHATRYVRRSRSLAETLRAALGEPIDGAAPALRAAWTGIEANEGKPLVVMLDQVEEAIVHGGGKDEVAAFIRDIASLFGPGEAALPKGRLLLGFRKEWAAEFRQALSDHGAPYRPFLLEPMGRAGVLDVVRGLNSDARLATRYALEVDDDAAEAIANELLRDTDAPIAPTLQVLLTRMWEQAKLKKSDHPCFSKALFEEVETSGFHLVDFLRRKLDEVATKGLKNEVDSGLALDVLLAHTTEVATAADRTAVWLAGHYGKRATQVAKLVVELKQEPCLLVDGDKDEEGRTTTRLVHDAVAPVVQKECRASSRAGQQARRRLEYRAGDWASGKKGQTLEGTDLAVVMRGLPAMREPTADERRLIEESRRQRWVRRGIVVAVVAGVAGIGYARNLFSERDRAKITKYADQKSADLARATYEKSLEVPSPRDPFDEPDANLFKSLSLGALAAHHAPSDDARLDTYIARVVHLANASPTEVIHLDPVKETLEYASVSADEKTLVSLTRARNLLVWSLPDLTSRTSPVDGLTLARRRTVPVDLSADGSRALAYVATDGPVTLIGWEVWSGTQLFRIDAQTIQEARYSPSGHAVLDVGNERCPRLVWPRPVEASGCKSSVSRRIVNLSRNPADNWALVSTTSEGDARVALSLLDADTLQPLLPAVSLHNFPGQVSKENVASSKSGQWISLCNDKGAALIDRRTGNATNLVSSSRRPAVCQHPHDVSDVSNTMLNDNGFDAVTLVGLTTQGASVKTWSSFQQPAAFSVRDIGDQIFATDPHGFTIWSRDLRQQRAQEARGQFGAMYAMTITRDPLRVTGVTPDGDVLRWNPLRRPHVRETALVGVHSLRAAGFSADNALVAIADDGRVLRCSLSGDCTDALSSGLPQLIDPDSVIVARVGGQGELGYVVCTKNPEGKCFFELRDAKLNVVRSASFITDSPEIVEVGISGDTAHVLWRGSPDASYVVEMSPSVKVPVAWQRTNMYPYTTADGRYSIQTDNSALILTSTEATAMSMRVPLPVPQRPMPLNWLVHLSWNVVPGDEFAAIMPGGARLTVSRDAVRLGSYVLHPTEEPAAWSAAGALLAVSPSGRWYFETAWGTGRVYETESGLRLTEDLWHPDKILAAAFIGSDDDQRIVTVCADGVLRSWYVAAKYNAKPAWLFHLAEGVTGKYLDGDTLKPLPTDKAQAARKNLIEALKATPEDPTARMLREHFQ